MTVTECKHQAVALHTTALLTTRVQTTRPVYNTVTVFTKFFVLHTFSFFRFHYMDSPRLLSVISEHIRLYFLVSFFFCFYTF